MPIDASIPLQVQVPTFQSALAPISALLGIKQQQQGLQQGQQALQIGQQNIQSNAMSNQTAQIALQEKQGLQQLLQDPSQLSDSKGDLDWNKALPAVMKVAPTTGMQALQQMFATQQQSSGAKQAINNTDKQSREQVATLATSLVGQPPDVIKSTLGGMAKLYPTLGAAFKFAGDHILGPALQSGDQKQVDAALQRFGRGIMSPEQQQGMLTPAGIAVGNGQQSRVVSAKPGTTVPQGEAIPGTEVQQQIPPTAPTISGTTPGLLGPQQFQGLPPQMQAAVLADAQKNGNSTFAYNLNGKQGVATQGGQDVGGFVASGLPAGASESRTGSIGIVNQHYAQLNEDAKNSQVMEGIISNIKGLAPGAITGTESGKKAYVTGLLNAMHLGNQATGDLQKDTDLLQKNMAQLNLATPANTDAMRTIVEAGRPHSTMSAGAIEEAAAQLTGQVQANRAVRNALTVPKQIADQTGDVSTYNAVRQQMENVADPRAWQYEALSPAGRKAFMSKLTPEDRATLIQKTQQLEQMGMFK